MGLAGASRSALAEKRAFGSRSLRTGYIPGPRIMTFLTKEQPGPADSPLAGNLCRCSEALCTIASSSNNRKERQREVKRGHVLQEV